MSTVKVLSGVVTDISLKRIPNVAIFASDKDGKPVSSESGQQLGTYTDDNGNFSLAVPMTSFMGIDVLGIGYLTARPRPDAVMTLKASANKSSYHFDFKDSRYQEIDEMIARPRPRPVMPPAPAPKKNSKANWWIIGGVGLIGIVVAIIAAKKGSA